MKDYLTLVAMERQVYWQRKGELVLSLDEQIAQLRRQMAAIDQKYADAKSAPAAREKAAIEEWLDGELVENEFGPHYQTERLFEGHRPHGMADVGALSELPAHLLDVLSEHSIDDVPPCRWAFLDTETTGLAGGSGTYAFLIGVGRITEKGFAVRQFFMRDLKEERSQLAALCAHLEDFDVLITYNGKTYDQPLLETRYRMTRGRHPFARLRHLDLLHGTRRLWKLRMESCKLTYLEQEILGVCREGDLPGHLVPYVYFEYLREGEARKLIPIFHHNAFDILTLACLTAIVPAAFRDTGRVRRGEELAGLGRWVRRSGDLEAALSLLKRAVEAGLPDHLLFQTLWDIACLEKKAGRMAAAAEVLMELAAARSGFQLQASEELARIYERSLPDLPAALRFTAQALEMRPDSVLMQRLVRRRDRLQKKLDKVSAVQIFTTT